MRENREALGLDVDGRVLIAVVVCCAPCARPVPVAERQRVVDIAAVEPWQNSRKQANGNRAGHQRALRKLTSEESERDNRGGQLPRQGSKRR